MATASVGAAFLLTTHLRVMATGLHFPRPRASQRMLLIGLGSGIAVALIEETVFRGVMHTAIERESGPWTAALLTAPLFAVLHFFAKARIPAAQRRLGQRLRFAAAARSRPWVIPRWCSMSFLSWLAGGIDLEPDPRADRQYRGGDRAACRLGGGAAHAAGSHRRRQLTGVLRVGGALRRPAGALAAALGRRIAAALWLTRASGCRGRR